MQGTLNSSCAFNKRFLCLVIDVIVTEEQYFSHIALIMASEAWNKSWKVHWWRWVLTQVLEDGIDGDWQMEIRSTFQLGSYREGGHRFVSDLPAVFSPLRLISLLSSLFLFIILKWWKSSIAITAQGSHELWQLWFLFGSDVLSRPLKQVSLILLSLFLTSINQFIMGLISYQ